MAKPSLPVWKIAEEQLDSGHHWSDPAITFSFPQSNADPGYPYGGFSPFSTDQEDLARMVLDLWSDVADITFHKAEDDQSGQIRFSNFSGLPLGGQANGPGKEHWHGDVHVNPYHIANSDMSLGAGALFTLLHEVGHALGLSHPGDYDADPENPEVIPNYNQHAEYFEDSRQYTVMSYFGAEWTGAQHYAVASTPLLHDIYAIQTIYGPNMSTREGDTVYGFNSTADRDVFDFTINTKPVIAIWDGGGNDTLDLSGAGEDIRLDLAAGAFSDVAGMTDNVAIAYGVIIENALGGEGDDVIVGNRADNVLRGGDGADELYGQQHGDYYLPGEPDADELYGEEGNDTLRGGFDADLLHGGEDDDDLDGGVGDDELNGGSGADFLVGDAGVDEIHGGSGDDVIYGHRSWKVKENPDDPDWLHDDPDRLYGGDGNDIIHGGFGNDWIEGDGGQDDDGKMVHQQWTGDDTLFGGEGNDTIEGGEGNDKIYGEDGVDYAYGGSGADTISGGRHGDFLYGEGGDDTIAGDNGSDELRGGAGADGLSGGSGEDKLYGEDGKDWLHGGVDRDLFLHGGLGIDTASYFDEIDRWTVDLANGFAINEDASYDEVLVSIENLELGSGHDTAYGTNGANEIWGGAGNDTIEGKNGNDILHGDAGIDILLGGSGADRLDPGADNDFVDGGNGNDTLTYDWTVLGIRVHLGESEAWGEEVGTDVIAAVENALGGSGDDRLYGDGNDNRLDGGDGDDVLAGFAGDDHLIGGDGRDTLMPGWGNDTVDGGRGVDTVDYSDTALDWTVNLSSFANAAIPLFGESQHTLIDVENATLGSGNDTVWGTNASNTLIGNDGNDQLYSGAGNDTLYGGKGADTLVGGPGADRLFGGAEADVFAFYTGSQTDTVYDFEDGIDLIDLSDMEGYDSFDDLIIQDNGGDAVILMGADNIVLVGTSSTVLSNSDFIWV